jgi:hypothetical protein
MTVGETFAAPSPPLCPRLLPPQSVAACLSRAAGRILSAWGPNHARPFTAHRSGRRQSGRRKHARKPTGSPSRRGTSVCSAFRVRRSHRRRWARRSMPGLAISKSVVLAATPTRPLPSTSCGDRRRRQSMNWNATCAAGIARRSEAMPTSGAIWSRCARRRYRPAIRRRHGGRENVR